MAENTGPGGEKGIGKALFKKFGRTKEKVMQNLGMTVPTTDSEYDQLVNLFTDQHNAANRLQKEVKNYMAQVKAMSVACQSMYETISESYESSWRNADKFSPATEELISLWGNRVDKLTTDIQAPLSRYADQFREVKKKIEKRSRKLTDFDGKRHAVESLENAKKRDEIKISKAHEEMTAAKSIYETIHNELCEELPTLYQSRIPTLCSYFRSLISSEAEFQMDCAKIKTQLAELIEGGGGGGGEGGGGETTHQTTIVPRSPVVKKASNKTPPRPPVVVQRSVDQHHHHHAEEKAGPLTSGGGVRTKSESGDQSNEYLTLVEYGGNAAARIASDSSDDDDNVKRNQEREMGGADGSSPTHSTDSSSAKKTASAASSTGSIGRIGGGGGGSNKELEAAAGNPRTFHSSNSSLDSNPKNSSSRTDARIDSPLARSEVSIDRKGSKASIKEEQMLQLPVGDKESQETGRDGGAAPPPRPPPATQGTTGTENGKGSDGGGAGALEKSSENVRRHSLSSSSSDEEKEKEDEGKTVDGAKYLYKVVAIHTYTAEDNDELSFEKGEVIGILPFEESSEEQDEGWLFGVKSSTGEKGVFPMNFTSKT